ncbi:MAG: amino acid dehydrogenase [Legionella sp.]|nr:amino acid dehydrogenase [Legionella sp.]
MMIDLQMPAITEENFLDYALAHGFGDLHFRVDQATGMKAIIAIHSTKLGPALGGCRFIEYPNSFSALYDAMRLARGMSYKAASVNLPLGGGKAVIIRPPEPYYRAGYLHAFGKFVNELGGRYITALDSGTQLSDMDIIAQHTPYVASLSRYGGDPSPHTAMGVLKGIEVATAFKLGKDSLNGLHVAIQGLGHVGYVLAEYLHALGVRLSVSDINPERVDQAVKTFGAIPVPSEHIHTIACDVFAPCALGGILNDQTIPQLQTTIVAGSANNQLAHTYHGQMLHEKGILYAPDYVINAGGLIFAASQYLKLPGELASQLEGISNSLQEIFRRSQLENCPTNEIADAMAAEKLAEQR